jgi:hypothetical protein
MGEKIERQDFCEPVRDDMGELRTGTSFERMFRK